MLTKLKQLVAQPMSLSAARLKAISTVLACFLALGLGVKLAWAMSDAGQCAARMEAKFLQDGYQNVPERAFNAAVVWCRINRNAEASGTRQLASR